jgi:iron-sulfur cluster repair protein YtfE (RIC family)
MIDLFTLPHKALRAYVGRTATRLGALDVADARAVEELCRDLHALIDELEAHGMHEDEFIAPLLDKHLPDLAGEMRAEHRALSEALERLRQNATIFTAGANAGSHVALYRHLRRFEAVNARHLDFEETKVMPALWLVASEAELAALMNAFNAQHPESIELYRNAPEALNSAEKALVLG